jgi:Tfp pilus assembly PilM family ATPase/Tfp pilus assembly protein PilN
VAVGAKGKRLVRLDARKIPSPQDLPGILRDLWKDGMHRRGPVILSLPRNLVTVRHLKLPSTDPIQLREMIGLQAAKQTPYSREEIITNFQTVGAPKDGFTDVILVIANREVSQERLKVLQEAHLKAKGIRLSSFGILHGHRMTQESSPAGDEGPVAVVDIDSNFTDFVVIADGQLIFTKAMSIGASQLEEGQETWVGTFTEEMKTALDLYERDWVGRRITKVVVAGTEIETAALEKGLAETFGLTVERASLFDKVPEARPAAGYSEIPRGSLSFSSVVGLAWNPEWAGIDLAPLEIGLKEEFARRVKDFMVVGILLISILVVLSAAVSARLYFKRQYLDQLRQQVQKTDEAREVEMLQKNIKAIRNLMGVQNSSLEVLSQLYRLIPPKIYLTTISFKEGEFLNLNGMAQEMSDVFQFVSVLEKQPGFHQVKIKNVTKREKEGEPGQTQFEITCLFTQPHAD